MSAGALVLVLVFLLPGLAVAAVVGLVVVLARRDLDPSQAAAVARRHALIVNLTAWAALTVVPAVVALIAIPVFRATAGTGPYAGVVAAAWPALAGLLFLAVHAVGERTWPRPNGTVRRAHLAPRDTPGGPRWLRRLTWAWAGLLLLTLVAGGITSSDGRSVSVPYAINATVSAGPYPGWYYGIPLLVAAALLLVATEGVLGLISRRPAVVDADPAYDAASRRLSAHRVLRGTQLVLALTETGVLIVAATALSNVDRSALGACLGVFAALVGLSALWVAVVPAQPAVRASIPPPVAPPRPGFPLSPTVPPAPAGSATKPPAP